MPKGIRNEYIPQDRKIQRQTRRWEEDDQRDWWSDLITERNPRVWQNTPACLGMRIDLFYPTQGKSPYEGVQVCRQCPARLECLTWAIENGEEYGVQGGVSEKDRRDGITLGLTPSEMIWQADN